MMLRNVHFIDERYDEKCSSISLLITLTRQDRTGILSEVALQA